MSKQSGVRAGKMLRNGVGTWARACGAGVLGSMLGGCVGPLNNELSVGDPLRPAQQFAPPSIVASGSEARAETGDVEGAERSVTSLDRSGWAGVRVVVPNDVPMHQPRYTENWEFDRSSARARGDFPTTTSALDNVTSKSADLQIKEAVIAPFVAGADVAAMPVRMIAARPWQRTRTGSDPYQRGPQVRTPGPEGLVPVEDGPITVFGGGGDVGVKGNTGGNGAPRSAGGKKAEMPAEGSLKRYPTSPGASAPTEQKPPAPMPPSGQSEEEQPKWDRAPVATDERGKNAAPDAKSGAKPEQEKK